MRCRMRSSWSGRAVRGNVLLGLVMLWRVLCVMRYRCGYGWLWLEVLHEVAAAGLRRATDAHWINLVG